MTSILNIFSTNADEFNTIILVPVVVVIVAMVLILKLSFPKQDVTKTSQNLKKQKTVHSKKEDKLASSDKKEKLPNENKKETTSSPLKSFATKAVDTATKNKKHKPEIEKPLNNHTNKMQNANTNNTISNQNPKIQHAKINNKDNKKAVGKNLPNKNIAVEQGEWQTVITKKQKLTKNQNTKDVSMPSHNIEKLQKTIKNKTTKLTKNYKEDATSVPIKEPSSNSYAAYVNEELTAQEIISTKSTSRQNLPCVDDTYNTNFSTIQQNHAANVDAPFISSAAEVVYKDVSIFNTPVPQVFNTGRDNVAFDELGDDEWTDTKPQKKNKKRALRE